MVLTRFKPGVKRSVHLFAAPLLWSCIGLLLMVRGAGWIGPGRSRLLILLALVLGTAKSLLVLDRTARRNSQRIARFRDGTCLGAIYSWKTWLLVLLMMAAGIGMRTLTQPGRVIGTLYVAIGWALLFSSRFGWLEWISFMGRD